MYQTVCKGSGQSVKFLDILECFCTVWNVSGSLESFRRVWKVSGQSGKFTDSLVSFRTVRKVSVQCKKCSDSLENIRTVLKVSRQCQKFPAMCGKHGMNMQKQFLHFWHILCRKSYFRTFGEILTRKRFTRSVWKVFASDILPTGKF